jgi:hypothetical protein
MTLFISIRLKCFVPNAEFRNEKTDMHTVCLTQSEKFIFKYKYIRQHSSLKDGSLILAMFI